MSAKSYRARPRRRRHYAVSPIVVRYLIGLAALLLFTMTAWRHTHETMTAVAVGAAAYLIVGIMLSRAIEERLVWNDNFTTLASAARQKLAFILTWPLATVFLIWRMVVVKFL